jgi:hypothetical protein
MIHSAMVLLKDEFVSDFMFLDIECYGTSILG